MRLRRQGTFESRQGVSNLASLRGARPHPRACRARAVSGHSAVLAFFPRLATRERVARRRQTAAVGEGCGRVCSHVEWPLTRLAGARSLGTLSPVHGETEKKARARMT